MRLSEFRNHWKGIAQATGRAKESAVRACLNACSSTDERVVAAMFLCGRLAHVHEPYTTGIKETFIANDLALEGQNSHEALEPHVLERAKAGPQDLDLEVVWNCLREYVKSSNRKNDAKSRIVTDCLRILPSAPEDAPILLRLLTGKTGNGVDEKTVLHAVYGPDHDRDLYSRLYAFNPDIALWVTAKDATFGEGDEFKSLFSGRATPGIPMEPQLCARVKTLKDVLKKHDGETLVQTKLDGMRIHIHLTREREGSTGRWKRHAKFFTREMKDVTEDYVDDIDVSGVNFSREAILDGELVAMTEAGDIAPFSMLQKRLGRKTGRGQFRVGVVLYDLLLFDDEDMLKMPYRHRLGLLRLILEDTKLRVIETDDVSDAHTLEEMLLKAHEAGEEGLVCKHPNSLPQPGQRSYDWVKLKADYMDGDFGDTFDLIVVGYDEGKGRRHGTVGALHCAVVDELGELVSICKVGTGLKDADLEWFRTNLTGYQGTIDTDTAFRDADFDVLVKPEVVIEVRAAQVSKDQHGDLSLRFPRFIKVRDDKKPRSATTLQEIQAALK